MRNVLSFNKGWLFSKTATEVPSENPKKWEKVNVPHCWNAVDGQDGGGDYHRGTCYYAKSFAKKELPQGEQIYLELRGTNSSADVYLNGKALAHHDGGYSTWRVNITDALDKNNLLVIAVDNSKNEIVYPQVADFTFYGGIYRDVNVIAVPNAHFDLDYYGAPGIKVTPEIDGENAKVEVEVYLTNADGCTVAYTLRDAEGKVVAETAGADTKVTLDIEKVHLWHGRKDPYLYTAEAKLLSDGKEIDCVKTNFGCRTFKIDPNEGFFLNGESYPLRGVSRHQDRWGLGNALLPEHHGEDIGYILEMGATTIRLAHYQHDQYFYDLCDKYGLVIWAEIPYISVHMPTGRENTISQMKELVSQNYNHPSIVVWGLSNEISMKGSDDDLIDNHKVLNELVHEMDKTRLTTIAVVSMCDINDPYIQIPDVVSYNHYFGWYGGDTSMNGPWMDDFHEKFPNIPLGMSEYGCEALNWHTSDPKMGDYTEEYQAYYHEELIKQLFSRKYIWATHVWNMFDFGADARNEGGENGQNHKGLMTFDRKYKKDSFYAYKAWLSDEPFVHLCGKRYVDRVEDVTKVTVYSNLPEVELFVNGKSIGKKQSDEHFFYFDVPNKGKSKLKAVAGDCVDESVIKKVKKFNEKYRLKEKGALLNWFDITEIDGYYSVNDTIGSIMKSDEGKKLFMDMFAEMAKGSDMASGIKLNAGMMKMMGGFTVIRLVNMAGTANFTITKEQVLDINAKLNKIKKVK